MTESRILIFSANLQDADSIAELLRKSGKSAHSISMAKPFSPVQESLGGPADCIVVDATEGQADGLARLKEIVLRRPDLPIVALVDDGEETRDGTMNRRAILVGAQVQLGRSALSADSLCAAISGATHMKWREQALLDRAFRDQTTGLSSRLNFIERLVTAFERSDRTGLIFGVAFLSIAGFDDLVARLGAHAGDTLIRAVADRLKPNARASDTIARLDIDEFVVLMEDLPEDGREDAEAAVERLVQGMASAPYDVDGLRVDLRICSGLSLYPVMGETPEELLTAANRAAYDARQASERQRIH